MYDLSVEPLVLTCCVCKLQLCSAWQLMQHIQTHHGLALTSEQGPPGCPPRLPGPALPPWPPRFPGLIRLPPPQPRFHPVFPPGFPALGPAPYPVPGEAPVVAGLGGAAGSGLPWPAAGHHSFQQRLDTTRARWG